MKIDLTLARKLSVTIFACFMVMTVPAVLVNDPLLSIAMVSIATMGYTGVTANMLAMPADVFPQSVLASIWGYSGLGSGLGGMIFALGTGWLVDHYSYVPVFVGFGVMPLVALLVIWRILGPLYPAHELEAKHAVT